MISFLETVFHIKSEKQKRHEIVVYTLLQRKIKLQINLFPKALKTFFEIFNFADFRYRVIPKTLKNLTKHKSSMKSHFPNNIKRISTLQFSRPEL